MLAQEISGLAGGRFRLCALGSSVATRKKGRGGPRPLTCTVRALAWTTVTQGPAVCAGSCCWFVLDQFHAIAMRGDLRFTRRFKFSSGLSIRQWGVCSCLGASVISIIIIIHQQHQPACRSLAPGRRGRSWAMGRGGRVQLDARLWGWLRAIQGYGQTLGLPLTRKQRLCFVWGGAVRGGSGRAGGGGREGGRGCAPTCG